MKPEGMWDRMTLALLLVGIALAAWNWYLKPESAASWAAALILLGCFLVVLLLSSRSAQIRSGVAFASVMMALALAARIGGNLGIWSGRELAQRGMMIILGCFFAFIGNAMPKTLTPLASLRCDPARVQAFQRFAGWAWTLTGLAYAMAWLTLPESAAQAVSRALMAGGILVTVAQIVRLRTARRPS